MSESDEMSSEALPRAECNEAPAGREFRDARLRRSSACNEVPAERERRPPGVDARIGRIAAHQRGFVTSQQLRACGLTSSSISRWAAELKIRPVHRSVYRVGHGPLPLLGREQAALLACVDGSALSRLSAAHVWGWTDRSCVPVHVTTPGRRARSRPGITTHSAPLRDVDVRLREGLRVTAPARTILDLAAELDEPERLERLVAQALRRRHCTEADLHAILELRKGVPGSRALAALLADGPRLTRSAAERELLRLLRRARLELPDVNVRTGFGELDFVWPRHRLVVEVDGFAFHSDRIAFEADRRRDQRLMTAGWRVIRVTWRQLCEEPESVLAVLAVALAPGCA